MVDGVTPALAKDMETFERLGAVARGAFAEIFQGRPYETEVVMLWREETAHGPIWCRGMLDAWCPSLGIAADPKFTDQDAGETTFARQANDIGYAIQNVWYTRGVAALEPRLAGRVKFRHISIETAEPYDWQAHDLTGKFRALAESQIGVAVDRFASCLHAGVWPGYEPGVRRVDPPTYAFNSWFDAGAGEYADQAA